MAEASLKGRVAAMYLFGKVRIYFSCAPLVVEGSTCLTLGYFLGPRLVGVPVGSSQGRKGRVRFTVKGPEVEGPSTYHQVQGVRDDTFVRPPSGPVVLLVWVPEVSSGVLGQGIQGSGRGRPFRFRRKP